MLYRFFRKTTVVLIAFITVVLASVFVFYQLLPNRFYVGPGQKTESFSVYGKFITIDPQNNKAEQVFGSEKTSYKADAKLMGVFPVKEVNIAVTDSKTVMVCGTPFGVKMFIDGVLVVGFSRIETESGYLCPAVDAGLLEGDLIKTVNGKNVFSNEDVAGFIENSGGSPLIFGILREGKSVEITLTPKMLLDKSGYKAGFWVRDSSAGIGTLTFYDPETMDFGGLGHAVCDVDTGEVLIFSSGEIVPAAVTSIKKGVSGTPGELGGTFTESKPLGTVIVNNEAGLYGTLEYEIEGIPFPIAHKQDVYEGSAVILSTISGTKANEYDIEIEKVSISDGSLTKNMVIRIVDPELISATGGIVQGMSGSPIIQDGKLIGAVTHVLVNDPTRGYGIFIENMLEAAE